jgi:hypothetical protein
METGICIRRSFNRRNPRSIMLANPPICWAQKSGNIEVRRKSSETFMLQSCQCYHPA